MKLWVTRPAAWDCLVKGLGRCTLWLSKPHFDPTPRGAATIRLYAKLPNGWRVLDDDGLVANDDLSMYVADLLDDAPELGARLWGEIGLSIDGQAPGPRYFERWGQLDDDEGQNSFLFECEAPPHLWWKLALHGGWEHQTAAARNFRERLAAGYDV
jgi:hypothetical protein